MDVLQFRALRSGAQHGWLGEAISQRQFDPKAGDLYGCGVVERGRTVIVQIHRCDMVFDRQAGKSTQAREWS